MPKVIQRASEAENSLNVPELHPLLRQIYSVRGIACKEDLERGLSSLLPFDKMKGIDTAVQLLINAYAKQEKILVVGDYDVDGAASTVLMLRALRSFGFIHVDYLIPGRFDFGYGLSPELVKVAAERKPDLILTVDNGIASVTGVAAAHAVGIKVIVTDHHLPGAELPNADAIVNPQQSGDEFESKNLAGVGVAFYLMLALRKALNKPQVNMAQFLDLVALGTVADIVALDKNNRILVHQGLMRIREGKCCVGIRALLDVAGRTHQNIAAGDLGYVIGPRLNAAGRLEDISLGIECLLTDDYQRSFAMATQLQQLNLERRAIGADMERQVAEDLQSLPLDRELPLGVCLFNETWHQGVVGVLASRIKDQLHRPVIAFAKSSEDEIKGSARSIHGLHMRDVLETIAIKMPDLITKFGGHAMAAGLTLPVGNYPDFCKAFTAELEGRLTADDLQGAIHTDGELSPQYFNLDTAQLLRDAGPWGQGFPEPMFDGIFTVVEQRVVGAKHLKLVLGLGGANRKIDAIAFNVDNEKWPNSRCDAVRAVYRLAVNEYRSQKRVQLIVEHLEAV